jgi:hypothetical protein
LECLKRYHFTNFHSIDRMLWFLQNHIGMRSPVHWFPLKWKVIQCVFDNS